MNGKIILPAMRTQPKFPLPQPVPTTPIQGRGIVRCDFNSATLRALARRLRTILNSRWAILKPQRNSVGILWRNQAFWWSTKGFYRTGTGTGRRRLFHHVLWEHYHGRPMPAGHEIFFRDRDYHNFTKSNLELLTKSELHRRIYCLGENNQPSLAARQQIANRRWERVGRTQTDALLDRFNHSAPCLSATLQRDVLPANFHRR